MSKKKLLTIVGSAFLVLLLIIAGVVVWNNSKNNDASTPEAKPETENVFGLPEGDPYAQDFIKGQPWYSAEESDGVQSYSNSTMIAVDSKGDTWAYVFNQDDSMPPSMSEILFMGNNVNIVEPESNDLKDMARESEGITYTLQRNWIAPPEGKSWGDLNFTKTDRTVDRLRSGPWADYIITKFDVNINDSWWDGKDLNKTYTFICGENELKATPVLSKFNEWKINDEVVVESILLRDGCKLQQ